MQTSFDKKTANKTGPNKTGSPVRADVRSMLKTALVTGLLAVGAQIMIPLPVVPINLGLLVVLIAGLSLPKRISLLAVGLYLFMGALGLPVFAGLKGGPQALFGPTGGYLLGYLVSAGVLGLFKLWADCLIKRLLLGSLAVLACYVPGTLWLGFLTGKPMMELLHLAVFPFIPGDALKVLAAALTAPRLSSALKRL